MLQAMDLQRLADWGMTKVSNKRIRVLLGYLLPAGMQIRQVGSTVEPGAHPSRRLFGRRGTWRAQSDKPHHCLLLTQRHSLSHGSNSSRSKSMAKHGTEQSHSTARPGRVSSLWEDMNNREIKAQLLCFTAALSETKTLTVRAQQQGNYTSSRPLGRGGVRGFEMLFLHSIHWLQSPKFEFLRHNVCQNWKMLADGMGMDQPQLPPAHRDPGWPSIQRSC